ncbi:hypothetical protein CYY_003147 [Polysphondylium violaceum]|uniref:Large ribosomal subunit protein uL23 N-terminal domain-containing protein n=1 Tax=Polysphondylium violaceum TaxID=133409 RepID=A0A8J4PXH5_9MYCE|nr:hypothetical protein CYY_003147 [Polysphondylium violaceum]
MTKKIKANTPKQDLSSKSKVTSSIKAPAAASKAKAAASAVKKGTSNKSTRKVRTSVFFRRPKTLVHPKKPSYPRSSVKKVTKMDQFRILKAPVSTESATRKIETDNTITFMVDMFANKSQIANAVKQMYEVKAAKVNTMITPIGEKKAFVKLAPEFEAADVANRIGIFV